MEPEDDYLSDKFLIGVDAATNTPKTYAQLRKERQKEAQLKNERNKLKSRRQLELESREDGLRKSLFDRAKEEEESGIGQKNKALNIMMKMGFKPGQALGRASEDDDVSVSSQAGLSHSRTPDYEPQEGQVSDAVGVGKSKPHNKVEPLPINEEWTKKKGIGLGKRAPSPTSAERVAKMAKMRETSSRDTFRDRTRQEYEERRAEGRLKAAQRTCTTLDEKAHKSFNILTLDPKDPESFPDGLMDVITEHTTVSPLDSMHEYHSDSIASRLRQQMQTDALQPRAAIESGEPVTMNVVPSAANLYSLEMIEEAVHFLRLNAQDRLRLVLAYLRDRLYCFWCGTQYEDTNEMNEQCPGLDEEDHD